MVRRLVWAAGILATVVVLALAGLAAYVARTWDRTYDAPLPEVRISSDPAVLARGEYLVYGPAHCVECHSGSFDALEKLSEGVQVPLSGKRGGIRVIYYLRSRQGEIWMLTLYAKNEADSIPGHILKKIKEEIDGGA